MCMCMYNNVPVVRWCTCLHKWHYLYSGSGLILPQKSLGLALKHTAWSEVRIYLHIYYCFFALHVLIMGCAHINMSFWRCPTRTCHTPYVVRNIHIRIYTYRHLLYFVWVHQREHLYWFIIQHETSWLYSMRVWLKCPIQHEAYTTSHSVSLVP